MYTDSLKKYCIYSAILHVGLLITSLLLLYVLKARWEAIASKNLKLVQASVRVDVVAMPELTIKELKQLPQRPVEQSGEQKEEKAVKETVEKVAAPKPDDVIFEKQQKKNVFDMLKKIGSQKIGNTGKGEKDKKAGSKVGQLDQSALKNLVLAGNKLSAGHAITQSGEASENGEGNQYLAQIPEWVRQNWRLPSYLIEQELRCRIRIYLDDRGNLIKAQIYESSGNADYDERALEAVRRSSPFPAPDQALKTMLARGELLLGFPL